MNEIWIFSGRGAGGGGGDSRFTPPSNSNEIPASVPSRSQSYSVVTEVPKLLLRQARYTYAFSSAEAMLGSC